MKIISNKDGSAESAPPQVPRSVLPFSWRMIGLSEGARTPMVVSVAVMLAVTATYVSQGVVIAAALARVFDGSAWTSIVGLLIAAAALLGVRAFLLWVSELLAVRTGATIKAALRRRLYAKLFELGPGYLLRTRTGTVQATVVDGVEKLETYFSRFLVQLVAAVIGSIAILIGLLWVDPLIVAVLAAAAIAISMTPLLVRRLQADHARWFWSLWRRLGAEYLDALQGMSMLKAFDASRDRGQHLAKLSHEFYRASIRFVSVANIRTGTMGLLSTGGVAIAVGLGVIRLSTGAIGTFQLLVILLLAREAVRPLEDLQKAYHTAYPALSAANGIFKLLDTEPTTIPPARPQAAPAGGPIVFDHVTFAYAEHRPPVVADVSVRIEEGETFAVVGRSGAGKTTLVALLLRFFDPVSGQVSIGGQDVRDLDLADLRRQIAVVSQETYLFHGTIRSNLALGDPDATDERIDAAVRDAGAAELIDRLPDGYDTIVGDRGLMLSGGERQRIAIARALLKDAPILVLDEATSSIDAENEARIQHALDRLATGRTTLVIAHRLSTVRHADRILLLEHGQASALGTHVDLLNRSAGYARLVAAQEQAS